MSRVSSADCRQKIEYREEAKLVYARHFLRWYEYKYPAASCVIASSTAANIQRRSRLDIAADVATTRREHYTSRFGAASSIASI